MHMRKISSWRIAKKFVYANAGGFSSALLQVLQTCCNPLLLVWSRLFINLAAVVRISFSSFAGYFRFLSISVYSFIMKTLLVDHSPRIVHNPWLIMFGEVDCTWAGCARRGIAYIYGAIFGIIFGTGKLRLQMVKLQLTQCRSWFVGEYANRLIGLFVCVIS